MMLDEALSEISDARKRVAQITERISAVARYQDGEPPAEDAAALLVEAVALLARIETLARRVNLTNSATMLPDGTTTLTAALARREHLGAHGKLLAAAADAATGTGHHGYLRQMRSELTEKTDLDVPGLRSMAASVAKDRRELDVLIQRAGMTTTLIET